jgi:hypothetical protein
MRIQWSCRATVMTVLVVSLGVSVWPSRAEAVSFGGEATAVQVYVPATGLIIKAATGQLPPTGGQVDVSLLSGNIPGSATGGVVSLVAGTLHSVVVGLDATDAESSLAAIDLTVSGNGITADFLMARSTASCGPGPSVAGSFQAPNLVINGQPIIVTGNPNQTVQLPNGTAVINEQTGSVVGSTGALQLTALHVTTQDTITRQLLADVKLAIADAQIDCQPGSGPAGKATSGGGWIVGQLGGKGTFGVHGGTRQDESLVGHLVYIDHGPGAITVQSTRITGFSQDCRTISGEGNSSSGPVTFAVTVTDNGEPGTGDTFDIQVQGTFGTYTAGGLLQGGNIKIHRNCP